MQEDKEGLFDTVTTLEQTLSVYTPMLASMSINQDAMHSATENDFSNATNLANYLSSKGIPFRAAHETTGKIVLFCIENQLLLKDLSLDTYQKFSEQIDNDVYHILTVESVVEAHSAEGGTSKSSVMTQLENGKYRLDDISKWIQVRELF